MINEDVRWKQRFQNFEKALYQLQKFVDKGSLNKLEQLGFIKSFEYTFELAWNVMKDYYEDQGDTAIQGSRDAIRLAFRRGLITDGEGWMAMIKSRILSAHTYNEDTANEVSNSILHTYYYLFQIFKEQMLSLE